MWWSDNTITEPFSELVDGLSERQMLGIFVISMMSGVCGVIFLLNLCRTRPSDENTADEELEPLDKPVEVSKEDDALIEAQFCQDVDKLNYVEMCRHPDLLSHRFPNWPSWYAKKRLEVNLQTITTACNVSIVDGAGSFGWDTAFRSIIVCEMLQVVLEDWIANAINSKDDDFELGDHAARWFMNCNDYMHSTLKLVPRCYAAIGTIPLEAMKKFFAQYCVSLIHFKRDCRGMTSDEEFHGLTKICKIAQNFLEETKTVLTSSMCS